MTVRQERRLSLQQERLWALQQAADGQSFGAHASVRIGGPLDPAQLARALAELLAQHEILRTSFQRLPGLTVPLQVIQPPAPLSLPRDDLADLSPTEQTASLADLWQRFRQQPCSLSEGPALRVQLVRLAEQQHLLLLALPALCADARGLELLVHAIAQAYASATREEVLQYADFAQWQHELLAAEEGALGRAYWREQARGLRPAPLLPLERPGGAGAGAPVSHFELALDTSAERRAGAAGGQQRGAAGAGAAGGILQLAGASERRARGERAGAV